ncbi:MAG: cell cycle transcriptional regulator TrcR [Pseudomonadota bacterium]|nr:cell cycle transcriptional regulator TrcR [Pseudomonadota bacterium]
MTTPLMPKATAVWLIDNTALSFDQIADFCQLHPLEVQAIADGEVNPGMQGFDPVANGQVTREEIERCSTDESLRLVPAESTLPKPVARTKGPRYVPVAKRGDKPDAIAWLIKHAPELKDSQIAKLIGTTKDTIGKVRDRSHWNTQNIQARHPVLLGLCNQLDLDQAIIKAGGSTEPAEAQVETLSELP